MFHYPDNRETGYTNVLWFHNPAPVTAPWDHHAPALCACAVDPLWVRVPDRVYVNLLYPWLWQPWKYLQTRSCQGQEIVPFLALPLSSMHNGIIAGRVHSGILFWCTPGSRGAGFPRVSTLGSRGGAFPPPVSTVHCGFTLLLFQEEYCTLAQHGSWWKHTGEKYICNIWMSWKLKNHYFRRPQHLEMMVWSLSPCSVASLDRERQPC